jgi:hypothetical protein
MYDFLYIKFRRGFTLSQKFYNVKLFRRGRFSIGGILNVFTKDQYETPVNNIWLGAGLDFFNYSH